MRIGSYHNDIAIAEITFALSCNGSPRPSCVSRGDKNIALPSCDIPASKDNLVLVDYFSKILF